MGGWTSGFFLGQFLNPVFVSAVSNLSGGLLPMFRTVGLLCLAICVGIVLYNIIARKPKPAVPTLASKTEA